MSKPPNVPPPLTKINATPIQPTNKRPRPPGIQTPAMLQPPNKMQRIGQHPHAQYYTPQQAGRGYHPQYPTPQQQPQYYNTPQMHAANAYRYPPQQQYQQQPQYQTQPQSQPRHQYNTRRRDNNTSQYYDAKKSTNNPNNNNNTYNQKSPETETVLLSDNNNKLPQRLLNKIQEKQEAQTKKANDKENLPTQSPMIYIGSCCGLLFGPQHNNKLAVPGSIKCKYESSTPSGSSKKVHIIKIYADESCKTYLGQTDTKLIAIFGELFGSFHLELKGKIIDVDLSKLQRKLPPNKFVRKIELSVSCQHEYIPSILHRIKRKVKTWKWTDTSIIFNYFSNEEVLYKELEEFIIEYIDSSVAYNGSLMQLEENFTAAFEKDITADELNGIDAWDGIVRTKLLPHQRVGLEWMLLRENFDHDDDDDDELPPFYTEKQNPDTGDITYVNMISEEEIDELPERGCGGILADDMGLGKTLQCISLIASNSGYQHSINNDNDEEADNEYGDGPTLIVAPLTVIGNWVSQIADHCVKDAFKILVYHGPNREKDISIIKSHNIVITTFDIVALEYSDETDENREEMRKHYGCGLQYVNWLRIVLDEAHKIRSRKTRIFKACNALVSRSRWCLSGTPVQNRLDDLFSLFRFLKLQPICDQAFWRQFITNPLKNGEIIGFERLRKVMIKLCLRRNKNMEFGGKRIIDIPDKVIRRRCLEFSTSERLFYLSLMEKHKKRFNKLKQSGDKEIMRNFSSVLSMLLRLRQCCAHTLLVPDMDTLSSIGVAELHLKDLEDSNEECASCGMSPDEPTLTTCNHIYCKDCFYYELEVNSKGFPCYLCGESLNQQSVKEQSKKQKVNMNDEDDDEEEKGNENDGEEEKIKKKKKYKKFVVPDGIIVPSTKMATLIEDVKSWENVEVGGLTQKAVVFSQWTSVLDLLSRCLDQENILYERLDGTMSRSRREAAMQNFRDDEEIPVFLMSLKAGNLGVNMTAANHVYMLDPWWNPATEDQAVDRVYRLGQKRIVNVNHFVIKDSVEEKILKIQERKRTLISSALGTNDKNNDNDNSNKGKKTKRKSEWLNDLKDLFEAR